MEKGLQEWVLLLIFGFFLKRKTLYFAAMRKIGDRISIQEEDKASFITISGQVEGWKETLLAMWVLAWTFCGAFFIYQLFLDHSAELKLSIFILLSFWAYFEYYMVYAFLWRKYGKERIKVDEEKLWIKNDVRSYGKAAVFYFANIKDFEVLVPEETSLKAHLEGAFWDTGGERIKFQYQGKQVKFGKQLKGKEARELASYVKHLIRENGVIR